MPLKPKITNILKRSNSFCDGSKQEAVTKQLGKSEVSVQDSYSAGAIDVVKSKNVLDGNTVGWCGGDYKEDETHGRNRRTIKGTASEEVRYKETLIDELHKSNHDLRIKLAGAENKIAQLRLRIEAHCECCSRGLGVEDYAEQKEYNDWSSGYSGMETFHQMNPQFWKSNDFNGMASDASPYLSKTAEDILNPYIKVKRWQDAMDSRNVKENDSSTGSTYALKRSSRPPSPHVSGRSAPFPRAESPSSGVSNDFSMLPTASRSNAPGAIDTPRRYDNYGQVNKNRCYHPRSFELGGNNKIEPYEDPIPVTLHRDTTKKSKEDWYVNPNHDQRQSDSSLSTILNSNDSCPINFAHSNMRDHQRFTDQYYQPLLKNVYQEQNQRYRRKGTQNDTASGIMGQLMKLREEKKGNFPK
ncbi:hypothetical protein GE061_014410 [Apolygus lucorum]|uniref:Uncharacterized protein n=1 Tax=Apolygus lucorum TaxID=248454 RepID=A0A8S9XQS0_APOLU|nr:hypothetical protein GE061_014410 [Apolygus lucorum]